MMVGAASHTKACLATNSPGMICQEECGELNSVTDTLASGCCLRDRMREHHRECRRIPKTEKCHPGGKRKSLAAVGTTIAFLRFAIGS